MSKLIQKHQQKNGLGRGVLQLTPEAQAYIQSQLNFVPGMNTNSNSSVQQANQQAKYQEKVDKDIKVTNKKIAERHSHRAIQERDQKRRTPNVNVTDGYTKGTIQDADKIALDKVLSWYGISNGLGQMTNVSDQMRNTPQFGRQIGQLYGDMAKIGLTTGLGAAITPTLVPGGSFWTKGIQWLNPSKYLGRGNYSTVMGGQNTSLLGATADAGLTSYGAAEALQHFQNNPNLGNGVMAAITGMPIVAGVKSPKIIHQARGKFNPILESDIAELENMLNLGQFREMTIPGSTQKVKIYFPSGNKQPIREDELQLLLSKYQPKRELSQQEREFAKQAPTLIKELKKKYGIDFSHIKWFMGRPQLGSNAPGAVTQLDIDIFNSHIPEYAKLAERLQKSGQLYTKNGKWFGKFEGTSDLPVNPEEYIVAHSNAFENNWKWDGKNYLSGMTAEQYNKLLNNGGLGAENWGTTNGGYAGKIAGETVGGRVVGSLVGRNNYEENILSSPLKNPTSSNYFGIGKSVNNGVSSKGITNIPIINDGEQSSWKVFGEDVQVKTLRGNNGDFSLKYKSPYKVLIPTILGGTFVGSINNK